MSAPTHLASLTLLTQREIGQLVSRVPSFCGQSVRLARTFMGSMRLQVWMKLLKFFTVFRTFGILLIALEKMLADFFRCGFSAS